MGKRCWTTLLVPEVLELILNFVWRYWIVSKERRLGRGLAALLGDEAEVRVTHGQAGMALADDDSMAPHGLRAISPDDDDDHDDREPKDGDLLMLSVYEIEDNPYQPRRDFSESEIVSLAESLKEHDMLQPVLVRRWGDHWQLISGERRWRAAKQAGMSHIKAQVRDADDRLVAAPVDTLFTEDDLVLVGAGLAPGDRVVVSDIAVPFAGLKLAPVEDTALAARLEAVQ